MAHLRQMMTNRIMLSLDLPGPWGFLTSGYILGLVIMAVLMHRIQNIVVPPRTRAPAGHAALIHRALLPLDLSCSPVRLLLRLPSLCCLARSLLLWSITLAQTAHCFPLDSYLGSWAARQDTAALCWFTFCAVCAALCIEALSRGLEGANTNASPFNLFGYAFLLHIYSSPMTHSIKFEGHPSRPDNHVIFTIILPLLQLAIVHSLGIKQSWSNHRLLPSAFVSALSLTHFHWVLWFSDATYPLLNYMPCLFESTLLAVTFLAIFLNALTQILTEGSLSRPLFGHYAALLPRHDEDFSIALLRMGTASLETSSVAGLGNEVGSIPLMSTTLDESEIGTVALTRFGVSSISHNKDHSIARGLANEIKHVKVATNDGDLWLDLAWYREFVKFIVGTARFLKRVYMLLRHFRRSPRMRPQNVQDNDPIQGERTDGQDLYRRFIHGEQLSDDEYDEYEPTSRSRSNSLESISSISDDEQDAVYDNQVEAVGLYVDLSSDVAPSTSTSHLLAHMTNHSSTPLTRRRFTQLVTNPPDNKDGWIEVIRARRPVAATQQSEDALDEARRNCVICTTEPRQIICWPCRCLALCDDCRENLASRSSVSKHTCPCCRTSVEGYSKIFIP